VGAFGDGSKGDGQSGGTQVATDWSRLAADAEIGNGLAAAGPYTTCHFPSRERCESKL